MLDFEKISYLANAAGALLLVFVIGKLSDYSKEIEILQQAVRDNNQTVIKLNSELERANKILLATETERDALLAKKDKAKTTIKEVVKKDENQNWNNTVLPADVRGVFDGLRPHNTQK